MILKLFLTFFKIGVVTFGGGYAMIPLITQEVTSNGWLTEGELVNLIAVSESTPGPFAINIATFIGSYQGGFLGSLFATIGVILPSFIIILLICTVLKKFDSNKYVNYFMKGVQPVVIGLILSTGVLLFIKSFLVNFESLQNVNIDIKSLILATFLLIATTIYRIIKKKNFSAIPLIIISAILGIIIF